VTLHIDDVSLVLGDGDQKITALDHVSLQVAAGELVAVVGPSGSGKSSLLACVGGLRRPTSGHIRLDGTDLAALAPEQLTTLRRDRIGFVFQQSNLVPSLTAVDQLLLTVHLRGRRPGSADRDKARALLRDVGMDHRENRRPAELSGGERQRVGIARALMSDPALMLVDEPTSMLDHSRGRQVIELLARECHQRRVATVMVTHDPAMLESVDRIVSIVDGRLSETPGRGHAAH
jgi:putative ABC transport system ATP-binding protein